MKNKLKCEKVEKDADKEQLNKKVQKLQKTGYVLQGEWEEKNEGVTIYCACMIESELTKIANKERQIQSDRNDYISEKPYDGSKIKL